MNRMAIRADRAGKDRRLIPLPVPPTTFEQVLPYLLNTRTGTIEHPLELKVSLADIHREFLIPMNMLGTNSVNNTLAKFSHLGWGFKWEITAGHRVLVINRKLK